jgi:hypothetical protein
MIIELISKAEVTAKLLEQLPGAGVGFVVAAFCPAIGRKIKAAYEALLLKAAAKLKAAEAKIVADGEAELKKA